MPKENNKMQVDIENLFKQNVNDLLSIKEIYSKLDELQGKISKIKYIDSNLANKLKKEYENFKKIILDENVHAKLTNEIETINLQMELKANLTLKEIKLKNNLKIGDIIITNGYDVAGDGGNGKYIVVTSNGLDNGYYVKINNTLSLKLLHNGNVRLEQFGGKSDNITDNAIAITNALTGSRNVSVHLKSGIYKTSPLNFDSSVNGNKLIGVKPSFELSNGGTLLAPYTTQSHLISFSGSISSMVKGFVFKDIEISDKENLIQDTIIKCTYCTGFTIDIYCYKSTKTIVSIKSSWEFDFNNVFIRNFNSISKQCILFDNINTNEQGIDENISTLYFKNVDLECINSPFIKSFSNSKASNIMIGTISFETNLTNLFIEDGLIDSFDKLKTSNPLPLFDFEFMNGLTIESINITGFSKKAYKDNNNTYWTNSLFKLSGFYLISVGNILIGDSSSYIYLCSGDGDINGVLNVKSLASSILNRTYTNESNNLVLYNNVIDGQILVNNNSFEVNSTIPTLKENIRYDKELLYKLLSNGFRGHFKMTNDSNSESKIVFNRIDTKYQSVLNAKITSSLNIKIKFKTSSPTGIITVKSINRLGEVINSSTYNIVDTINYQELIIPFIKETGISNIKIEFPTTMNDVYIDYISTSPYIKQFESGKNATSSVAQEVKSIKFKTKFNTIPNVIVSLVGGTPSLSHTILVNNITKTGFEVYCSRANATFCYIAMEE